MLGIVSPVTGAHRSLTMSLKAHSQAFKRPGDLARGDTMYTTDNLHARLDRINAMEAADPQRFAQNPLGPQYLTRRGATPFASTY